MAMAFYVKAGSTMFAEPTPVWSKKRKLIHKILNMYGEGVHEMESVIHDELSHVVQWLESHKGLVNLDHVIYPSLSNILAMLLVGKRYDYDSKVLANIRVFVDAGNLSFSPVNNLLLSKFPFLRYIPIGPGKYTMKTCQAAEQFLKDVYEETKATYDPEVTRGMIDYLLRQQEEERAQNGESWLSDEDVKAIVLEMVDAGSSTTRGALYEFFLIMVYKPEVAKRIQEEIDEVIGPGRLVKIDDRANMPYTVATIFELLRYTSHVPLAVPHVTTEDVTFKGYSIPKRTPVLPNLWGCHHDEKVWPDPWEYKPERFLDENMKLLPTDHPNRKNLIPFGIGRRFCVGETFARSRMFVFIVTLLQRFNFSRDPERPLPPCDPRTFRFSAVMWPDDYYVRIEPRV
ncbi:cytochrome P450 2U1-like isoform X2 [Liolophura sinensis]|uniref:cytochrome P450 2U1-like isoform X2 n=1 Tax=Liolophura sinensis TaxID=3198878 RepID=UPI00315954CB